MRVGRRAAFVALCMGVAALSIAAWAGIAAAVSGGGYSPAQQDCPTTADSNGAGTPGSNQSQNPYPGCHNFAAHVEDGHGDRYASAGLDQLPVGYSSTPGLFGVGQPGSPNSPHSGCAAVNTAGTGGGTDAAGDGCGSNNAGMGATTVFDANHPSGSSVTPQTGTTPPDLMSILTGGLLLYVGADDNLDAGEHDGVNGCTTDPKNSNTCVSDGSGGSANGPSDGGAITVALQPVGGLGTMSGWQSVFMALVNGGGPSSLAPVAHNPGPVAGASTGECADGFCLEATTRQQTLYSGGTPGQRDVYNYQNKSWDPYNCSSGSQQSEAPGANGCGNQTLDQWRQADSQSVTAEPGVQVYEDPDPQGSPIDPLYEGHATPHPVLYPIPSAYVGTCGVVAGGGPVASAPAGTPMTNSAGQVVANPTGC
jgi:hypothetical protein